MRSRAYEKSPQTVLDWSEGFASISTSYVEEETGI